MRVKHGIGKIILPDNDLMFIASDEAKICLNCTEKRCNGECKKYKKEIARLKKENGKNT